MAQYNDAERQAGTLILSDLKMFNEAVVFFEQHIIFAFWKGFDQCVERFIKANNWVGSSNYELREYLWLAHPAWVIEDDDCKYWFENYSSVSKGNDYSLAVITGSGTEQGEFGFQFKLNPSCFGGTKKLNAYVNTILQEYREQLVNLGFIDQGKGNFFLPITLDSNQLAECWKESGAFPEEHEVFIPLRNALNKLLQSTDIFDAVFLSEDKVE
ncbi:TPA: hypothetical protein PXN30_002062 [Yersinia enterocolitica]|uniref:hypothetical protein n=1 Tax=Yersinia TaxID=629 RepID=UPI001CFDD287|nr:hypothetical protein [Yersinia intermedia]EKN4146359.1 hypothetical protein [Yersinia enterocolitica]EKN5927934.1 hypothetical protein [Yersinia enterocolitica]EKN6366484.1 hypothetical protein [Yersinia enterocolitica]ELZ1903473.1 hypothetical protein [Yersinia enterocolitica]MCB5326460.1 hypothetical protein [Yersinia intermedia]